MAEDRKGEVMKAKREKKVLTREQADEILALAAAHASASEIAALEAVMNEMMQIDEEESASEVAVRRSSLRMIRGGRS